jgi:hypothetical protein
VVWGVVVCWRPSCGVVKVLTCCVRTPPHTHQHAAHAPQLAALPLCAPRRARAAQGPAPALLLEPLLP